MDDALHLSLEMGSSGLLLSADWNLSGSAGVVGVEEADEVVRVNSVEWPELLELLEQDAVLGEAWLVVFGLVHVVHGAELLEVDPLVLDSEVPDGFG